MRKWTFLMIVFLMGSVSFAQAIDAELAEKMAQNPESRFHVMAFFKERLVPERVVEKFNIRGDEFTVAQQVVEIFKQETQRQYFWLSRSPYKVEELFVHELIQAVSFKALPQVILEIAKLETIGKIVAYTQEQTKPAEFFLKRPYYEFKTARITEVGNPEIQSSREVTPEQIINILKQLWDFVKENQPVVNTAVDVACAVPQGITNWQQLAGWQEKHTGQYVIEYVNLYGITVVKIVLRVHFYHSGNYNGIGKYITCATASIDQLNVLWGYTLNAEVKVPSSGIVNIGTSSAPVAGMKMFVHWKVHTIIQHQEGTRTYSLDGNGNISSY